jgi:hypothetical protein
MSSSSLFRSCHIDQKAKLASRDKQDGEVASYNQSTRIKYPKNSKHPVGGTCFVHHVAYSMQTKKISRRFGMIYDTGTACIAKAVASPTQYTPSDPTTRPLTPEIASTTF